MVYVKIYAINGKIGADDEDTSLRIIVGETRAAEQGCYFDDGPVRLIVKCSSSAADSQILPDGSPVVDTSMLSVDGQEARCLHFPFRSGLLTPMISPA